MIYQEIKDLKELDKTHPAFGKKIKENKNTIFICKNQSCSLPITTFDEFAKIINNKNG